MNPDHRLPLHDWHASHGASFTNWMGWELPESYDGASQEEYGELQSGCALIDMSHAVRLRLEGGSAARFLNEMLTLDVTTIRTNCSAYGFLCNERGGIEEGFLVYRDEKYYLLVGSSPRRRDVLELLDDQLEARSEWDLELTNVTASQGEILLRGPGAKALLEGLFLDQALPPDPGKGTVVAQGTSRVLVLKAPYGLGGGYFLVAGIANLEETWDRLYRAGKSASMRPVGLTARRVLRIETGMAAAASEWDGRATPFEVGEESRVDFYKPKFLGKRALLHSSTDEFSRRLVLMRFEPGFQPKPGMEVNSVGTPVGKLTSTAHSPAWGAPVALGFVHWVKSPPGTMLQAEDEAGRQSTAEIVSPKVLSATTKSSARRC